ncbi:SRPBCC family protein [Nocardioides humilatus]|uniref:SRPBCC family protein n=1 Tax=Nocardioides humilatus TaxID=2607660 RepID=A0A5B1L5C3_9ACTN|nr:SRPBCC family protein [Nocardioides humilatus]KAA1415852.1 SRPBCC family protein [Nocardioides humilatus]
MAEVRMSRELPHPVAHVWEVVSDLSRLGEWLTLHEGWRSEVPEQLDVGVELTGIVKAKGVRNKITWLVQEFDPASSMALSGKGIGGTSVAMSVRLKPKGSMSTVDFRAEFAHPALKGPLGTLAARTVKADLESSLARLTTLL